MTDEHEPDDVADELDEGDDVRRLLQGLPEVAPPEGFYDGLIRRRRRRARTVAGVALVAAGITGGVVVAQATGITGEASPPMSALAERHDDMDEESMEGAMDDVPAPYQAPEELGGMRRGMMVRHPDDVVQLVYGDGGHYLSVFEQPGELDDDTLLDDLEPVDVDGVEAWQADDGALVVRRDDVVYVLVGDLPEGDLSTFLDELPDARPMGIGDRIGDAMDDLVDAFGFG